jgi:ribosomal protein L40E
MMTKKSLGYVELQWTCPNCGGINPGPEKVCGQCGVPQPDDVEFEQVKGAELTQDEAVAARVKAGPDIHCPYCGARNLGDAETCTQCGGDLVEGERREGGKVLGAYKEEAVGNLPCPHCGAENPENAKTCSQCGGSMAIREGKRDISAQAHDISKRTDPKKAKRRPIGLIIILVLVCLAAAVFIFLSMRTEAVTGTVAGVGWERWVSIEGLQPVKYSDWRDQIPSDAEILSCDQEVRSVEGEPQPNSEEVCGTPYSEDTGSGYAEVVQDCEYHVYDDYCTYSVIEWAEIDTVSLSGNDFSQKWPDPVLSTEQRLGEGSETYTIYFDTNDDDYTYSVSDYETFQQFQVGTEWNLEINTFGNVVSVEP